MARKELKSYMEVHAKLVEAMQEACTRDESGTYEKTNVAPGFIYEETNFVNKSKSRGSRFSKIAAIFIIVLLGMNLITLSSDSSEVYGEKGLLHRIFEGTRGIFTDSEAGQAVEFDETGKVWIFDKYEQMDEAKSVCPKLSIPEYMPSDYSFNRLKLSVNEAGFYLAEYEYTKSSSIIYINITDIIENDKFVSKVKGNTFKYEDRFINVYWDDIYKSYVADIYMENSYSCIYGSTDFEITLDISKSIK